ncbi:MAG TPA: FapA family protein [Clostridia bacterium]
MSNILFKSEHVLITQEADGFYIESFQKGMTIDQFNKIMACHAEIKITNFMAIKNSILLAPRPSTKFGELKDRITVDVSSDGLKAYITLAVMENEFEGDRLLSLVDEIQSKLSAMGIVFGIKKEVLINNLVNNKQILIAEGIAPVNGEDSIIRLYDFKEPKPEIKEDGNADHYELNLINKVVSGEWLGERLDPTGGIPGKSVMGNTIMPLPGKMYPILYDKNSVKEVYENGKSTLYALKSGAVAMTGGLIGISNHLQISGDVDFSTGNVDFNGFLTVNGTIADNFSVTANKDVEILGDYGVGSIKEIISREGRIYIKGGIAGKNRSTIKSRMDIYTKFVSDANIVCEGSVHIGFYCLNSTITAKEVILDSPNGQIIGGNIRAEIRVIASVLGSSSEKRTVISITGFNRSLLREKLEKLIPKIEEIKNSIAKVKQTISSYSDSNDLTREQKALYMDTLDTYSHLGINLKELEYERRTLTGYLMARGEGEISILRKAYPNTVIEIKSVIKEIDKILLSTTFYFKDGEVKELT